MLYRGNSDTVRETIIVMLANFANMFLPGIKLTLVARHVSNDDAFVIFSEDSLPKVIETIQKHEKMKATPTSFQKAPPGIITN